MDIRSRRMCGKRLRFQNPHCIRLRRLQKDGYLIVYDREWRRKKPEILPDYGDRRRKLAEYRSEWESYSSKISELFSGEESEE